MRSIFRRPGFGLFAVSLLIGSAMAQGPIERPAAEDKPYRSSDLRKLLRQHRHHDIVVEEVRQRGLDMKITSSTPRTLRSMGFTDIQIGALTRIAEKDPLCQPNPKDTALVGSQIRMGPRMPGLYQDRQKERVDRIIYLSGLPLKQHVCGNVSLVATDITAKKLSDHVTKTDALVRSRFPTTFKKGLNPKSAHIVVLDDRVSYRKWVEAVFKVYTEDGMMGNQGGDPKGLAMKSSGWNMGHITNNDSSVNRDIKAKVAFDVGYLYASELSEGQAPPAITCGFGNVIEEWMTGKPGTMLISYDDRELKRSGGWAKLVFERMKKNEHTKPDVVLATMLDVMKGPQYAESWSLTELLCGVPGEFERFLRAMRDGQAFTVALQEVYDIDLGAQTLEKAWVRHAQTKAMRRGR